MKKAIPFLLVILFGAVCVFGQTPSGAYSSPANGSTSGTITGQVAGVVNPTLSPYNAPVTQSCANLSVILTNGSNTVGCSTATFTSADVGKVIFASCCGGLGGQNKSSSTLKLTQGVINSIVDSTHVTVCTTTGACTPVNATASSASGTLLYWGFKADTAVATALTDTYAGPGPCKEFFWSGILMVSSAKGNGPAACILPIGATNDTNLSIAGTGRANSLLLMSPDFDYSGCTGGVNSNTCFFGLQGIERKYFGINGGGFSNTGSHAVVILDSMIDDFDFDIGLSDIGAQDALMICYQMDGSGAYPNFVEIDGCGSAPIVISTGTANTLINGYAADVKGPNVSGNEGGAMRVKSGATVNTYGMYFGPCNTAGSLHCVNVNAGGTWYSNGDICITGAVTNCVSVSGIAHLNNFTNPTDFGLTADRAIFTNNAAARVYITNSSLFGTVAPLANLVPGTIFLDSVTTVAGGGTNTGITPTCTFTSGGGTSPSCTVQAGSLNERGTIIASTGTGSPGTTGTITLTFAGTFAAPSGIGPLCVVTVNNSGTAWGNMAIVQNSTQSTTAPLIAWANSVGGTLTALTVSSPYRIDYSCVIRP